MRMSSKIEESSPPPTALLFISDSLRFLIPVCLLFKSVSLSVYMCLDMCIYVCVVNVISLSVCDFMIVCVYVCVFFYEFECLCVCE